MKIVQINATLGFGSTGRNVLELAEHIEKSGNTAVNIYAKGENPGQSNYNMSSFIGNRFHWFLSVILGNQGFHSRFSTKKMLRYLSSIKPDIVHLHNLHNNFINIQLLGKYLSRHDIPTVITLHDCWFFTGKCCHHTKTGCDKWISGCYDCPRIRMDNKSLFFDRSKSMYHAKKQIFNNIPRLAVIGVSDWVTDEAKKSYLGNAKIVKRVYNGIDLEVFRPIPTNLKEKLCGKSKKFILGVSTFWDDSKGHKDFCKLAQMLGKDYQIILVGQPPKIGRDDRILYIGRVDSTQKLAEYYSAADIFVSLSEEETGTKVISETLACGTPAAGYDATAIHELIPPGGGGLADPGNLNEICRIVKQITAEGKEKFSAECIRFAKENFNKTICGEEYLSIYKQLSE